jgi:teichuronic acid exporter
MSIRRKTARSGLIVTLSTASVELSRFVSLIVLARLLEPTDFGIVTLATVFVTIGSLLSGLGLEQALIAIKQEPNKVAFHVLVMTLCSGALVALLIIVLAPQFASAFEQDQLTGICRLMVTMVVFDTLFVTPSALLAKDMLFGRLFIPNTLGPLSGMLVAVVMAYEGFGLWSLVWWRVVDSIVKFVAVMAVCTSFNWLRPYRWDARLVRSLIRFGVTNIGTGIVSFGYQSIDKIIVGKFFGLATLGFYAQAHRIANLPVDSITSVFNRVLLPAYAEIREDRERLARAFLNSFRMLSVIMVPIGMGLLILAPELIIVLLGEKWRNSIPLLQIFAFLTLMRPLSLATVPLFIGINRPDYTFRTVLIIFISMSIMILSVLKFGISALALAIVCAVGLGFIHNMHIALNRIGMPIGLRDILIQVWPIWLAAMVMVVALAVIKHSFATLTEDDYRVLSLMGLVVVGMLSYGLTLFTVKRILVYEILELVLFTIGRSGKPSKV